MCVCVFCRAVRNKKYEKEKEKKKRSIYKRNVQWSVISAHDYSRNPSPLPPFSIVRRADERTNDVDMQ